MLEQPIETFQDVTKYIWQSVLVPTNIQQTSYFPSDDKLKRLFQVYLCKNIMDHEELKVLDNQEFQKFVICCILLNQANKIGIKCNGVEDVWTHLENFFIDQEKKLAKSNQSIQSDFGNISFKKVDSKKKEQTDNDRKFTIHQLNLISLITKLIKRNMEKSQARKNQNQPLYDFVELQSDQTSVVLFQNKLKQTGT